MVFACQTDSFLKEFTSPVKSCEKIGDDDDASYEVICDDTILFPEGGGQPYDTGYLNELPVFQVLRRGAEAVHFVKQPLPVGSEVKQLVDWDRRFDHMQQHSGQHLITAVINSEYKYDTTAWWLGIDVCHIELNTTKLNQDEIDNIERIANQKIVEDVAFKVKVYEKDDPLLDTAQSRGLPSDVAGPIRVVEIVGMEDNLCCGTHVTSSLQLQAIKLLYAEKGKKNKMNLFFVVGGRVLRRLSKSLIREQKMIKLLNSDAEQHVDLVEKLQISTKSANKKLSNAFKQLAIYEAKDFLAMTPRPPFHFHHNKDGDQEYVESFLRAVKDDPAIEETLLIFTIGDNKGPGFAVIYGRKEKVADLGPKIADILGGKGAAHGPKFQAKVSKLANLKNAVKFVNDIFNNDIKAATH